jgi:hypothetical protein
VQGGSFQAERANGIPPAESHENSEYVKRITIPLNETYAFTPRKKLRVVTIGAGYSGMILAQKLQHKYAEEVEQIVEHVIYEARDSVGVTWAVNTYSGVMCDVPSAIYVCLLLLFFFFSLLLLPLLLLRIWTSNPFPSAYLDLRHSRSTRTRSGVISIRAAMRYWSISSGL